MRAALACAVGCERGPIAERIEIPSLRARWRSDRVEQSIAIGVRKHAPRKAGGLIQIVVAVKLAQGRVQQIVREESITRTVVTGLIPVLDCDPPLRSPATMWGIDPNRQGAEALGYLLI